MRLLLGVKNDNINTTKTDTYNITSLSATYALIDSVKVYCRCLKTNEAAWIYPCLRTGETNYFGSSQGLSNSWTDYYAEWTTNPATGLPFTVEDIAVMEIGGKLQNLVALSRMTQCWAVVTLREIT